MNQMQFFLIVSFTLVLASCEIKVKTNNEPKAEELGSTEKMRNNIQIQKKGLNVSQAYLQYEDGKLLPADNRIELKQTVKMKLLINGWKEENGKVYIGGSETIKTNTGDTLLHSEDLFAEYLGGVSPVDAKILSLSAVVNNIDSLYDYFLVSFHLWDKKGTGEINGSYKLYLK